MSRVGAEIGGDAVLDSPRPPGPLHTRAGAHSHTRTHTHALAQATTQERVEKRTGQLNTFFATVCEKWQRLAAEGRDHDVQIFETFFTLPDEATLQRLIELRAGYDQVWGSGTVRHFCLKLTRIVPPSPLPQAKKSPGSIRGVRGTSFAFSKSRTANEHQRGHADSTRGVRLAIDHSACTTARSCPAVVEPIPVFRSAWGARLGPQPKASGSSRARRGHGRR